MCCNQSAVQSKLKQNFNPIIDQLPTHLIGSNTNSNNIKINVSSNCKKFFVTFSLRTPTSIKQHATKTNK